MSDKVKETLKDNSKYKSLSIGIKLVLFLMFIIIVLQSFTVYSLLNNESQIVGITEKGIPIKLKKKDREMSNLINIEQFMRHFTNLIYDWNYKTYEENIEKATSLMSNDLKEQFLSEIKKGGYIEQVKDYKITSSFTIRQVDVKNIKNYKNGYKVIIKGYKLEITDFIDRKKPMQIEIGFKTTDISNNNIWGLEVFEIKERRL